MEGAIKVGVDAEEQPMKLTLLTQAMPELAEGLHGLRGDVKELQSEHQSRINTVGEQLKAQSVRIDRIHHLLTSGLTLQFMDLSPPTIPPSSGPLLTPDTSAAASHPYPHPPS